MLGAGATGVFHCFLRVTGKKNYAALYIIEFPKGLEMGKEIEGGKREKRKFGGKYNLTAPNHKSWLVKTQLNAIYTLTRMFYCFIGKKTIDF